MPVTFSLKTEPDADPARVMWAFSPEGRTYLNSPEGEECLRARQNKAAASQTEDCEVEDDDQDPGTTRNQEIGGEPCETPAENSKCNDCDDQETE